MFGWGTPGSYIDPIQKHILYNEYPDVNNANPDPNVNFMLYYEVTSWTSDDGPCIEYNELSFYLNRLHEIIYTYTDENLPNTTTLYGKRPPGLSFVPGFTTIWTPNGEIGDNYWWEHRFWMRYATRVNLPPPPPGE